MSLSWVAGVVVDVVGSVSIRLPEAWYWRLPGWVVVVGAVGGDCVVRAIVVGGVALACAADGCGSFAFIVALFTLLRFFFLDLKLLELVLLIVMSESLSDSLAFAGFSTLSNFESAGRCDRGGLLNRPVF